MSGTIVRGGEVLELRFQVNDGYKLDSVQVDGLTFVSQNGDTYTYRVTATNGGPTPAITGADFVSAKRKISFYVYRNVLGTVTDNGVTPQDAFERGAGVTVNINGKPYYSFTDPVTDETEAYAGDTLELVLQPPTGYEIPNSLTSYQPGAYGIWPVEGKTGTFGSLKDGSAWTMPDSDLQFTISFKAIPQPCVVDQGEGTLVIRSSNRSGSTGSIIQPVSTEGTVSTYLVDTDYYINWYKTLSKPPEGYSIKCVTYSYTTSDGKTVTGELSGDMPLQVPAGGLTLKAEYESLYTYPEVTTVKTLEDLENLRNGVNGGRPYDGKTITLDADLTLPAGWVPIGTDTYPFTATFDGNGHTLTLNTLKTERTATTECVGLFGWVQDAKIQNLNLEGSMTVTNGVDASGVQTYVGSIAGQAMGACEITNCVSNVAIMVDGVSAHIGGLVGYWVGDLRPAEQYASVIKNCINYGDVTVDLTNQPEGNNSVPRTGGLVGSITLRSNAGFTIEDCGNYGAVTPEGGPSLHLDANSGAVIKGDRGCGNAGGLVGEITGYVFEENPATLTIIRCLNKGDLIGDATDAGGLVGEMMSNYSTVTIESCYNTGAVINDGTIMTYDASIGGLVGYASATGSEKDTPSNLTVNNCYSTGRVALTGDLSNKWAAEARMHILFRMDASNDSGTIGSKPGKIEHSNCFTPTEILLAANQQALLSADYVEDPNGGLPLLPWELLLKGDSYLVTFNVAPDGANPTVTVYSDAARTKVVEKTASGYLLEGGGKTYYYRVTADGYVPETGNFTVIKKNVTVSVELKPASDIIFQVSPIEANFTLKSGGVLVEADEVEEGDEYISYCYTLYTGTTYTYDAYAEGYNSYTNAYTPYGDDIVEVKLTKKATGSLIYGDRNKDLPHEITEGGTYIIGEGAMGVLTVNTTQPVILAGAGVGQQDMYQHLYINCVQRADLTLKDVYISNSSKAAGYDRALAANLINFPSGNNNLTFSGISILEQNTDDTGYAMIHVGPSTTLNITGGRAYLYKNEQGSGIGGNGNGGLPTPEANGTINIQDATLYIKGTKQGAAIGSGAGASNTGSINISNSDLYVIANARGAGIGGAAGGTGAAPGGTVTVKDSTVTVNVDWTGAAIGGGGYDGGNDAQGGTLTVTRSSIRTYIDANAEGYWNVPTCGVNGNKAITATVSGNLQLLTFDTTLLSKAAGTYTVKEGNTVLYDGGLHYSSYVNEDTGKAAVQYTMDNWGSSGDKNLYLYVSGQDHTLDVNGERFEVTWDEESKTFTIEKAKVTVLATTEIVDGLAITTINSAGLTETLRGIASGTQLVITADIPDDASVYGSKMVMTRTDVQNMANAGVSLKTESPIADVSLTNAGLKDIAGQSGSEVTINAITEKDGVHIEIAVDGKVLEKVNGGLTVTLPIPDPGMDAVLVMVNPDGSETILENAVIGRNSITVTVDGSCVLKVTEKPSTTLLTTTVIENGVAITTVNSQALKEVLKTVTPNTQLVITPDIPDGARVYGTKAVMTVEDTWSMALAGVSLKTESPIADITLSNIALIDVGNRKGSEVTISAITETEGISIEVAVDGVPLTKIESGIRVTLHLDKETTKNTVLVMVNADGTETVLTDAVIGKDYITVTLDGSCIIKVVEQQKVLEVLSTTVIENGKATTTINSEVLAEVLKEADASTLIVIAADIPEGVTVTEAETLLIRDDVRAIAASEASLKVSSPLADVTLSNAALKDVAGAETENGSDEVTISAAVTERGTYIKVAVNGKVMSKVDSGLLVSLPVDKDALTPGTVMVLVDEHGQETVIKKSVAENASVTARLSGSCTVKAVDRTKSFDDVKDSHWYAGAVAFATGHDLFNGVSETKFDPTGLMTRSMLVTVLHRLEDTPAADVSGLFGDVPSGTWYTDAVDWASGNSIVTGTGTGFNPDGNVTREQIATILYRYMQYLELDTSARGVLSQYNDGNETSDWAYEAMQWAVGAGIITGKSDTVLDPGGNASRAEVATMLQRLIRLVVQ